MNTKNKLTIIVILIAFIAGIASATGIFSDFGTGTFEYQSIRGKTVEIYGKGIYQHMSADVAIQGIAQDYITLFVGVPLLIISLIGYRNNSVRAHFLLAGTLGYFLVTYLFYITMGMYNVLFLAYAALLGLSFFGFFITLKQLNRLNIPELFSEKTPHRFVGWLLIVNPLMIAVLWLGVILPPLFSGTIYPDELNHYTTLIVQGLDLGLLLPACFVTGVLLLRRKSSGYLYGTTYSIFLSVLMTALTAKIVAMAINGVNVIPVIFIIPTINVIIILSAAWLIANIKRKTVSR